MTGPDVQTPTAMDRLIDDYLASARARGLSPKTIAHYEVTLHRIWQPFCDGQGVTDPSELNSRFLDRFAAHLLAEGGARGPLSKHSVHSYLGAVRNFLSWAKGEGEVGEKVKVPLPRLPQRVLEVLSREEIRKIEDVCESERDKLIVRVLADTGIRLGELVGLRTTDLVEDGRNRLLRVRGKGRGGQGQERLVPVSPSLYSRLHRYATRGRPQDVDSERIFVTRRRREGDYTPLQARTVQDNLRWAAERAGITRRVHPHLLRHSFATWCLRRGMNPLQLQRILGHSDLGMITRTYSHLNVNDAAEALMAVLRADED